MAKKKSASKKKAGSKKSAASKAKSSKKKSGGSKKKTKVGGGGGPGTPLSQLLKNEVVKTLKYWQFNFGRSGIKDLMVQLLNPTTTHAQFLQWMFAREQTYSGLIKAAKNNGNTYPWVVPIVGAVAFESMFNACAAFWLAAGDPPAPDQLRPAVIDFIDLQVGLFVATVGAS
jgi:hypothetical protein